MEKRAFGRTGLKVGLLGYGAGAVGGLMVRGSAADQETALARAVEAGTTYIDTAADYGGGASETNLGRVLGKLKPDIILGTKVRIRPEQQGDIAGAIAASMDESLKRLNRAHVDLFQLHNPITAKGSERTLTPAQVMDQVLPAFIRLREQGKCRFLGFTAIGEPDAILRVIDSGRFDSAQVPYNMLNPTAVSAPKPGSTVLNQKQVMIRAQAAGMGVIGIRVLAAGALSGTEARHPGAMPAVDPIASGDTYAADVAAALKLKPIVDRGYAADLVEAAIRFAGMPAAMSTILVGTASLAEQEHAIASIEKGPLPPEALALI